MDYKQKENRHSSRGAFIKKTLLALVSVLGLGLVSFNLQKPQGFSIKAGDTLSNIEANNMIKNMHTHSSIKLNPEPPPKINQKTAVE